MPARWRDRPQAEGLLRALAGRLRRRPGAEAARPIPLHAEVLTYLHITATLVFGGALRPPRSAQ